MIKAQKQKQIDMAKSKTRTSDLTVAFSIRLRTLNTLQPKIEFCVQLPQSFKQFSSKFQNSLTQGNWMHQSLIIKISLKGAMKL